MTWNKLRLAILLFFTLVLCLQLPATLYIDNKIVLDFMSIARIIQLVLALVLSFFTFRKKDLDTLSIFLIVSIIIQAIAAMKFESPNEVVAYNFTAILIIISAITFRGKLNQWLIFYFPFYVFSLIIPIFYKSKSLYASPSLFVSNFLFGIFSLAIALVLVIAYTTQEFFSNRLKKQLAEQEARIKLEFEDIQKQKVKIELGNISSQLAHDIRSPLSALNMAMDSLTQIPNTEKKIITNAIQRINDIANDLLKKGDGDNSTKELQLSEVSISQIIEPIITEKQMQYKEFSNIVIESDINKDALVVAQINTSEFQRVISNLINNSVEAFKSNSGEIIVSVKKNNDQVEISIKDNGKGIPSHLLEKLGQEGFSYGKNEKSQGGSGLGLFHAKQTILKFNGKMNIESTENNGTTILIQLPLVESAPVKINSSTDIVLIDNDQLVRMTWEMRAKKSNKKILCLASYAELKTHLNSLDRNTIFYIDVHISDNEDGVQVSKDLFDQGFTNLYLATGYEPEKFAHVTWIKGVVGKTPVV
jgi:signal transduction histidine kinase